MKLLSKPALLIILNSTFLILNYCSENATKPADPPIEKQRDSITVSIEQQTHRSISLRVNHKQQNPKDNYVFNRIAASDTSSFLILNSLFSDTVIIDDNDGSGLTIDTEYGYFAYRLDSTASTRDTSNFITGKTLPPTSHDFSWTEQTIGELQSVLYDVWGTDENNVYAVGTVTINDTTYGVLKWNGAKWQPELRFGGKQAVFGFNENDIWIAGNSGVSRFYEGKWIGISSTYDTINNEITVHDQILHDNKAYTAIWGTSSENLYFGSEKGSVIYWDGEKGTKILTADYPIRDIWGADENHFHVAAGIISGDLPGELYAYKNGTFELIKEGISPPYGNYLLGPFLTVWYFDSSLLYLGGGRIYSWNMREWQSYVTSFGVEKIRGNNTNDIIAVGHVGGIVHYNGLDWMQYQQTADRLNSVWMTGNKVFAVGRVNSNAYITIGTRN